MTVQQKNKMAALFAGMALTAVAAPTGIAVSQAPIPPVEPNVMRTEANAPVVKEVRLKTQFVVCGGGLSGICAALSAARHGVKVVLVQDRPMLGGNASSEMRMGIMGAAGDQNKEAGILEELQLKNFYYNPLRRYTLWDDVMYSGDGILRLSGAKFRHGRELPSEFGEDFQQGGGDGRTMGNSILLQLRKTEEDHPFHAPSWAYKFTDADFVNDAQPKEKGKSYSYKRLYPDNNNFWWIEFGGNFDTIGDANAIQLELKKIAYGVWDYMKNHPDGRCKGYDLDWIGALPGKRESVRFVGPRILNQHDVMSGGHFEDVVAYGGWTLDDHHPDAFWKHGHLSEHHRCPSPFGIPFDCLYSVNVPNLMFAGRALRDARDGHLRHDRPGRGHRGGRLVPPWRRLARRSAREAHCRAAGHARGRRLHAAIPLAQGERPYARGAYRPRERAAPQRHRPLDVREEGERRVDGSRRGDDGLRVGFPAEALRRAARVRLRDEGHHEAHDEARGGAHAREDARAAREAIPHRRARQRCVEDGVFGRPQHPASAQGLVRARGGGCLAPRRDRDVGPVLRQAEAPRARLRLRRALTGKDFL